MAKPPLVRAVVDSNLLIRGILRRRAQTATVQLREAILREDFRLITSHYLLNEVEQVLWEPAVRALMPTISDAVLENIVGALADLSEIVEGSYDVTMVPRDIKDNPVVACALEGGAQFIVTDDRRDLLPLKVIRVRGYRPIQIVSARFFVGYILEP